MTKMPLIIRTIFSLALINLLFGVAFATDKAPAEFNEISQDDANTTARIKLAAVKKIEPSRNAIIMYRQALMIAMGGHVKAAFLITENKMENEGRLMQHLNSLNIISHELQNVFPANTGRGSDALSNIWEEPRRFNQAIVAMQEAVGLWLEAAKNGEFKDVRKASRKAAKACRGCHDNYRTPTDD